MQISLLIHTRTLFHWRKHYYGLWIYILDIKNVLMLDLSQLLSSPDVNWVVWITFGVEDSHSDGTHSLQRIVCHCHFRVNSHFNVKSMCLNEFHVIVEELQPSDKCNNLYVLHYKVKMHVKWMSVQREEDRNTESRKRSRPQASAEVFSCKCVTKIRQTSESV